MSPAAAAAMTASACGEGRRAQRERAHKCKKCSFHDVTFPFSPADVAAKQSQLTQAPQQTYPREDSIRMGVQMVMGIEEVAPSLDVTAVNP